MIISIKFVENSNKTILNWKKIKWIVLMLLLLPKANLNYHGSPLECIFSLYVVFLRTFPEKQLKTTLKVA